MNSRTALADDRIPRATYRLQFSPEFRFADAAAIAPYLAALGISHVYASPFFAARPGSTHGYDIIDHNRINPELGGEDEFREMVRVFRAHKLGLIADFVPNHMGIGGSTNPYWSSVLAWGEESPYNAWFDIDWNSSLAALAGKVLVPFLGDQYGEVLQSGGLQLRFDEDAGEFAVWAHDTHKLPICPRHYGEILGHAPRFATLAAAFDAAGSLAATDDRWQALHGRLREAARDKEAAAALATALESFSGRPGDLSSWSNLEALVSRQHWRASKYSLDRDAINYRRFFVISDLAGLRVERPELFDATHQLVLRLLDEELIDGMRIDHIDGLRDPKAYLLRLRERVNRPFYLLVEKILAPDERLPLEWETHGTTGYEFANLVVGLLVDPSSTDALTRTYHEFTHRRDAPERVVRTAKLEMMSGAMAAEVDTLTARLYEIAQRDLRTRDFGRHSLRVGLMHVIAGFDVYRTYADADGMSDKDRERIDTAVARAKKHVPALDAQLFDFVGNALKLSLPQGGAVMHEFAMRAQQVTGPVMAKGLEDTALYRYNRLIALNEVGSEPGIFHGSVEEFHAANLERREREPLAMLATTTHDTKRGEGARVRIAAISFDAELWRERVFAWRDLLHRDGIAGLDPNDEYLFYQLLLGAWPAEWAAAVAPPVEELRVLRERVQAAMLKSTREAGRNTRWVFGDPSYEETLLEFVQRALDPDGSTAFLASFGDAAARFTAYGMANALVQPTLKLTVPGVPDIYQGAEVWEQSMVDPDNRRSVDFEERAAMLEEIKASTEPLAFSVHGSLKMALTVRLLAFRRAHPALFAHGSYEPLSVESPETQRVCAFVRRLGEDSLLVAAAIGWRSVDRENWAWFNRLPREVPQSGWQDVLNGLQELGSDHAPFFERMPVVVLFAPGRPGVS